jgi:hypothetical protein
MAAKESELSLLHSLLTNVFTLDCKTCIDEGIPMAASDKLAIAKFLKDNAITCEPDADDMEELRKAFESGKDLRRQSTASTILGNAKDNLSDSATKEVLDSIIN